MRATRALIHLANLRHNIRAIRARTNGGKRICLAVKADAYGHGIIQVARVAVEEGVEYLGVATVDEGLSLREAGISGPILLYSVAIPEEFPDLVRCGITPMVADLEIVRRLESEARRQERVLACHLKIDTGMGRIGCTPREAPEIAEYISRSGNLVLAGVCTHFASSDIPDRAYTENQISQFDSVLRTIRDRGIDPGLVHAANSGAILYHTAGWYDMVRPGIAAYGYPPAITGAEAMPARPVMELQSQVVFIKRVHAGTFVSYGMTWQSKRDTCIGTVPIGYGDGYNRLLSNRAEVFIDGKRYPVVGRVCMDQTMVDLGPECTVDRFSTVILFGPQGGAPTADEIATLCDTIPYEVTCSVSRRVPRIYVDEENR